MNRIVRDICVSSVLANLVLLGTWRLVLDRTFYFAALDRSHFFAVMLASLLLTLLFLFGIWLFRWWGAGISFLGRWLFLQIVLLCIFRLFIPPMTGHGVFKGLLLALFLICPVAFALHPSPSRKLSTLLVALVPCVPFLFLLALWQLSRVGGVQVVRGDFARLRPDAQRVLLIVFDEMSEDVAFEHRPPGIELPAFDRLRRESLVATAAYPPGGTTLVSMPALLTGKPVKEAKAASWDNLQVRYQDGSDFVPLDPQTTIVARAHALGFGTAVIGWYHPYCLLLRNADFCAHMKGTTIRGIYTRGTIITKMLDELSQTVPIIDDTRWAYERRWEARCESQRLENSVTSAIAHDTVAAFRSGLVILHLPLPHPPALDGAGVYFSNFKEADRELERLRTIMETAGTWDGTAVLITSDHGWREDWIDWSGASHFTAGEMAYIKVNDDQRVPFIVKLPGQRGGQTYTAKFNVVLASSLIPELLGGRIKNSQDLSSWLDLHSKDMLVPESF